jgi:exonuclease V gamma subunit
VSCKTACAYLAAQFSEHKDPEDQARSTFEGTHQQQGEYQESPTLQRVFNSFADVATALPEWAMRLYAPMAQVAQITRLDTSAAQEGQA